MRLCHKDERVMPVNFNIVCCPLKCRVTYFPSHFHSFLYLSPPGLQAVFSLRKQEPLSSETVEAATKQRIVKK
jgi:hypothetical protein